MFHNSRQISWNKIRVFCVTRPFFGKAEVKFFVRIRKRDRFQPEHKKHLNTCSQIFRVSSRKICESENIFQHEPVERNGFHEIGRTEDNVIEFRIVEDMRF